MYRKYGVGKILALLKDATTEATEIQKLQHQQRAHGIRQQQEIVGKGGGGG